MQTALRLTIQFAWAYLGILSAWVIGALFWSMIVAHRPLPFAHGELAWRISNTCVLLLGFLILGAIIRIAWRAIFRFSEASVTVTIGVSLLVMICLFIYGKHSYLQPWIEAHLRSIPGSVQGVMDLTISAIGMGGAWKFCYVMQRAFAKVLFPGTSSSPLA
jgi:hypothetical protein